MTKAKEIARKIRIPHQEEKNIDLNKECEDQTPRIVVSIYLENHCECILNDDTEWYEKDNDTFEKLFDNARHGARYWSESFNWSVEKMNKLLTVSARSFKPTEK